MIGATDGPVFYGMRTDREDTMTESGRSMAGNTSPEEMSRIFSEFVRQFRYGGGEFPYRERLLRNVERGEYFLSVRIDDFRNWNGRACDAIERRPMQYLFACERGIKLAYYHCLYGADEIADTDPRAIPDVQLQLRTSGQDAMTLRDLSAEKLEQVVVLSGIVIQAARAQHKAHTVKLMCRQCKDKLTLHVLPGRAAMIPRVCRSGGENASLNAGAMGLPGDQAAGCGLDPYSILPDECGYWDTQHLKLQEKPEQVPTGEMPRHIGLAATRALVDRVVPGARVKIVGVLSAAERDRTNANPNEKRDAAGAGVRTSFVHVLGIEAEDDLAGSHELGASGLAGGAGQVHVDPDEEEKYKHMARDDELREKIRNSIAPAIYGLDDVKRAVACLLFGGARKKLPDGTNLRGDINVLLLGDPGTAKSQFLKFVERAAPVAVYTSGKGSSAAGLTAAIVRDASGNFALEGGAMVLADGGVVCIDEFDKMRTDDRVAIHEAMEQQTISIAKAGITTVLNTRCSVLAAANPVFGTYDDAKEAAEQLDFQSTILSRFDLIFLVRDERDAEKDMTLAKHVIGLHAEGGNGEQEEKEGDIPLADLKRFIAYCRRNCSPRLTPEAAQTLENTYVEIRGEMARNEGGPKGKAIPITVRQLEAITRISESLAKMELSQDVSIAHVEEAVRLFTRATLEAARSGLQLETLPADEMEEVRKAEEALKQRIHVNGRANKTTLVADLSKRGFDQKHIYRAIQIMVRRNDLEERADFTVYRRV